jgi:4'-phosphopantetheinyl transferase
LNLPDDEIHVWLAFDREFADELMLRRFSSMLTAEERARAETLRFEHLPRQYLVTRALQRSVLSRYVPGVEPADWRFIAHPRGKPALAPQFAEQGLHFNIAHTSRLVAMAVAREPTLGVDVECLDARAAPLQLATRYFTPAEAQALAQLPSVEQARRFYTLWTLKESWLKATGEGLRAGLANVAFTFGPDSLATRASLAHEAASGWQFWQAQPGLQHVLALAVKSARPAITVRMFRWTPADECEELGPARRVAAGSGQEQRAEP